MNSTIKLPPKPTLGDVLREFERWRATRRKRKPIPEKLWEAAVGLSSDYTPHQISKALHLNYLALKKRIQSTGQDKLLPVQGPSSSFIEIDFSKSISTSEFFVEIEKSDGAKMKMSFKNGIGINLIEIGKLFLE
ncbi:MAG: hypothetical protein ACMUJM_24380 [bacterium]